MAQTPRDARLSRDVRARAAAQGPSSLKIKHTHAPREYSLECTPPQRCEICVDGFKVFPPGTPTDEGSEVSTAKEPRWRKLLAMHDFHET
jgi:hypothetical protein